jgi:hypothetical protein
MKLTTSGCGFILLVPNSQTSRGGSACLLPVSHPGPPGTPFPLEPALLPTSSPYPARSLCRHEDLPFCPSLLRFRSSFSLPAGQAFPCPRVLDAEHPGSSTRSFRLSSTTHSQTRQEHRTLVRLESTRQASAHDSPQFQASAFLHGASTVSIRRMLQPY